MHSFLCVDRKPVTIRAKSHLLYEDEIKNAFRAYWPDEPIYDELLYGIVYYFHKNRNDIDADNLCKPIFDALVNELYADDEDLKLVRSATFDLSSHDISVLNLTKMPENVFLNFLESLDKFNDIIYIEIGKLDYQMYEFACEL